MRRFARFAKKPIPRQENLRPGSSTIDDSVPIRAPEMLRKGMAPSSRASSSQVIRHRINYPFAKAMAKYSTCICLCSNIQRFVTIMSLYLTTEYLKSGPIASCVANKQPDRSMRL